MAIPFSIPNAQSYMPKPTADYLSQPDLGDQPLNQSAGMDPVQAQLINQILSAVTQQPPTAPPRKQHGRFVQGMINADPYMSAIAQHNYETSPAYQQYAQQMESYQAKQKALGPLATVAGSLGRNDMAAIREQRLQEAQKFRQNLLSQFKADTRQEFDYSTGTNRYHTYYRDPLRNNQVVYDEWTDYLPIHTMQYPGPGGEPVSYTTSPMPEGPPPITTGAPGGASAGAPGITVVPRPTEGGQTAGQRPSNLISEPMPRRGQSTQLVRPKAHAAPVAAAEQAAGRTAFASGLDQLVQYQTRAYMAQTSTFGQAGLSPEGIPALAGQAATDAASKNKYLQPLVAGDLQAVKDYNVNMQPMLFAYVKQQTGVQFGMKEFAMYGSQFPTSLDDPDTAIEKLGGLVRSVRLGAVSAEQQFHGLIPDEQFHAFEGKLAPRSEFRKMPPAERMRYIIGGGAIYIDK